MTESPIVFGNFGTKRISFTLRPATTAEKVRGTDFVAEPVNTDDCKCSPQEWKELCESLMQPNNDNEQDGA